MDDAGEVSGEEIGAAVCSWRGWFSFLGPAVPSRLRIVLSSRLELCLRDSSIRGIKDLCFWSMSFHPGGRQNNV